MMICAAFRSHNTCARCGHCCRWPGIVRIQPAEVDAIAGFLGLSPYEFTALYTRLLPSRTGLSLTETEDGNCVFLAGNECRIHDVKPLQCRDFPYTWTRESGMTECQLYKTMFVSPTRGL